MGVDVKAAIAFDLDGTLIDSSRDIQSALNGAVRTLQKGAQEISGAPFSLPYSHDEVVSFIGEGARVLCELAIASRTLTLDADVLLRAFRNHYRQTQSQHTEPYRGIPELLHALKDANISAVVCTNKPREFALTLVEKFFPGLIDFTLAPEDVRRRKPHPDMLLEAKARLPGLRHFVGDSLTDIEAGRRAGIETIAVLWGFADASQFPKDIVRADSVETLRDLLFV